MSIGGLRADDVFYDNKPARLNRNAKKLPSNIELRHFIQIRTMGYRLKKRFECLTSTICFFEKIIICFCINIDLNNAIALIAAV